MIAHPKFGSLSQGSIFTCALAEDYTECAVHGLVITARCDLAQNKVSVHNYLPIVRFVDWVHRDGRILLGDRVYKSVRGKLSSLLKENNFSDHILDTEPLDRIAATLFSDDGGRKLKDARRRFETLSSQYIAADKCLKSRPEERQALALSDVHPKERSKLIADLAKQQLNGFYFLSKIDPDGPDDGYVVLLREVQQIPSRLGGLIAGGLSGEDYKAECVKLPELIGRLCFAVHDYAMPIGAIESPHIEHLMQTFSYLFSRIGLPDLTGAYIDSIWDRGVDTKMMPDPGGAQ